MGRIKQLIDHFPLYENFIVSEDRSMVSIIIKAIAIKVPDASVVLTGKIQLFSRLVDNALGTMAKSYSFALVIITLLMIIMIGRFRIGLMSMAANVAP